MASLEDEIKLEPLPRTLYPPAEGARDQQADYIDIPLGLDALNPLFPLSELLKSRRVENHLDTESAAKIRSQFPSPFDWSLRKKTTVLCGTFVASILSSYSAGAYSMASEPLMQKWHLSTPAYNVGIFLFVSGFGIAPMILAPVSEIYGRYWVFLGAGVVFFLGTLGCAVTNSFAGMLVSRFVTGNGASIFATLTGGVISDLFHNKDRNTPMALYSLAVVAGTGLGPLVSGFVVRYLGWRWVFYLQLITIGFMTFGIFGFFAETRANIILKRKCEALNRIWAQKEKPRLSTAPGRSGPLPLTAHAGEKSTLPVRFRPETEEEPKLGVGIIWHSFTFSLKLLLTESVVFWFSAWISFAWAILYMQFSSIGLVFRGTFGFTVDQVGAVYGAVIVGSILGTIVSIVQEPISRHFWPQRMATPEGRLQTTCVVSALLPAGLFWFGWSASPGVSWILPTLAIGCCMMGILSIYLAVFNYLADTYHCYASSAQAAQSMCRNLLAGVFPLFTDVMFRNLTFGVAGSLLGGIGICLTFVPWVLFIFGEKIRGRSPFAGELKDIEVEGTDESSEDH